MKHALQLFPINYAREITHTIFNNSAGFEHCHGVYPLNQGSVTTYFAMQSSPPTRRTERPESPDDGESQYDVNFDALDMNDRSGASTPLPQRRVDRVFSEDIDGPSDFTLNLTKYLKDGRPRTQPAKVLDRLAQRFPGYQSQQDGPIEDINRDSAPQQSITLNDGIEDADGIPESSEWDPHGQASTPEPPPHRQFLQPTVEDYHSELTPAHLSSIKLQNRISAKNNEIEPIPEPSPLRNAETPHHMPTSLTSSPTKSPVNCGQSSRVRGVEPTEDLTQRLAELEARCKTLQDTNATLERTLSDERKSHTHEMATRDAQLAEAARREGDLREMKDAARQHMEDFRTEFAGQREQLRLAEERLEQERSRQAEESTMSKTQAQNAPGAQPAEMQNKLFAANRAREEAEHTVRQLHNDFEAERILYEAEVAHLKLELQQVEDGKLEVADLEGQLRSAQDKLRTETLARETAEENASVTRAEFERHREVEDGHVGVIGADHRRAIELAEGFQAKLRDLQQQLLNEQNEHDQEIVRLRKKHEQSRVDLDRELEQLRNDAEAKQSEINSVLIDRDAAQDDLANSRGRLDAANCETQAWRDKFVPLEEELHTLRKRLADIQSINALLDASVSEKMQKREAHWRAKFDVSEKERRLMAKALMHSWGREEVGVALPQMYEYKFATPPSSRKGK